MLSEAQYENLQQQLAECNCTYKEQDLRLKRTGQTGLAHSQMFRQASTKEMILHDVSIVALNYPNDRFHIDFDGIAGFTIMRNGEELLNSNYYTVEHCYQVNYDEFRNKLIKIINSDT